MTVAPDGTLNLTSIEHPHVRHTFGNVVTFVDIATCDRVHDLGIFRNTSKRKSAS